MELLIAVVIILAVSELKEWRAEKRHRQSQSLQKVSARRIQDLEDALDDLSTQVECLVGKNTRVLESFEQSLEFIREADANLKQILRDYEIKVRSMDSHADFVEGL